MKPECPHYRDCGRCDGGCCDAPTPKPFGTAYPSHGTCNVCRFNARRGQIATVGKPVGVPTAEERAKAEGERNKITRSIWRDIHTLAFVGKLTDAKLDEILRQMPCGSCASEFAEIRKSEPLPTYAHQQFSLTVGWHNVVNCKLDKPLMTVEQAATLCH